MRADFQVTALVSTFNGERFLRGCLEDLVAQTLFDRGELEIVVVDSASPQNEAAIIAEFAARFPEQIRVLRTPDRETLYAAWNRAVTLARGTYLTSANVDDRHHPAALEKMATLLDARPDAALVYADSVVTTEENATWDRAEKSRILAWPAFDRELLFEFCYIGQAPLWRRALHERYGMFDAALCSAGDYEFWLRLARGRDGGTGETFLHVPEPLGLYLERPDALSISNIDLNWRESEIARDRHWNPAAEGGSAHPKFRRVAQDFARLRERIMRLPPGTRVALFGAGKHTERMWPLFLDAIRPHAHLAGILDDRPTKAVTFQPPESDAVPVVRTSEWHTLSANVIIVSSDTFEMSMYTQLRAALPDSVMIWRVYHALDRKVGVAV